MSVTIINNEQEKENLLKLLSSFNSVQDYYNPNFDDINFGIIEDRDGNNHCIVFKGEKISRQTLEIIHDFYGNYFGAGTMCLEKSNRINKVIDKFCKENEIRKSSLYTFTTLLSFSIFLNPYINDLLRMSEFEYIIQKHIESITLPINNKKSSITID